jgi:hypothetical protein
MMSDGFEMDSSSMIDEESVWTPERCPD